MPIIHVKISYNSETLKDWEGLSIEKETKNKRIFWRSISYLSPEWWEADFEVKFSPSKTLVGEKISAQCIMGFKSSAQNCKNVGTLIQCGECDKWCIIYSKSKLSSQEKDNF